MTTPWEVYVSSFYLNKDEMAPSRDASPEPIPQERDETATFLTIEPQETYPESQAQEKEEEKTEAYSVPCCPKRFTTYDLAITHSAQHSKKVIACDRDDCPCCFTQRQSMLRHIRTVHDRIYKYECEKCGRQFEQTAHLQTHKNARRRLFCRK